MKKIALIASAFLIATTAAASAHSVEATKSRQAKAIEQGRQTGEITWTEGVKLRAEQRRIARHESELRDEHGHLSSSDHRELRAMQKKAWKHIAHEKNDRWWRAWWLPRVGK
jgi:hypothetical protein